MPRIFFIRFGASLALAATLFAYALPALAVGAPPTVLSYQGRLQDSSGNLLGGSGTTYYFKFSIWNDATVGSGSRVWPTSAPTATTTTVRQGVFTVNIGAPGYPDALNLDFSSNSSLYLQVEVSANGSSYETLSPRQQISAAAYAQLAGGVVGTTIQSAFGTTTPYAGSLVTFAATSSSQSPLSIIAAATPTQDLLQIFSNTFSHLFSITSSGALMGSSTATSTLAGGFFANALRISSLTNCDTIDTDANGYLVCGTDATSAGAANPFSWPINFGQVTAATSSTLWAQNGIFASSTSQFVYASSTALSVSGTGYFATASTTNLTVAGIQSALLKTGSTGIVSAAVLGTDYVNFAWPFAPTTNYGAAANSTSTSIWFTNGLQASSTSQIAYASTTALTVSGTGYFGTASTTNLTVAGIQSSLLKTGSTGVVAAAVAGTDYVTPANLSAAFPFTSDSNYGTLANSTTSALWFKNGLQASTTSQIAYASTTALSISGTGYIVTASTTNLTIAGIAGSTQCLHVNSSGTVSGTGSDCGSGGGGTFSFTSDLNYGTTANSTTTALWFKSGVQASSTSQFVYASTTAISAVTGLFTTATTSNFYGAGLNTCQSGSVLTYDGAGKFGCAIDQTSAGAANPFAWTTNYGVLTAATSSILNATAGIFASSTSHFVSADFTNATTSSFVATGSSTINTLNLSNALGVAQGGTALSSATAAAVLLGNYAGTGYQFLATSSLGLLGSSSISAGTGISYNSSTGVITNLVGFPFTSDSNYGALANSTTSALWFKNGFQASSTANLVYASSTALTVSGTGYFGTASTTSFYAAGLGSCSGTGNKVVWTNGSFSCDVDQTGASAGAANFAFASNYAVLSAATSSPVWAQSGIFASSTSHFVKADFTEATSTNFFASVASSTNEYTSQLSIASTTPGANTRLAVGGGNIVQTAGSPTLAAATTTASKTYQTVVVGRLAYLADYASGLRIIDVSNPRATTYVGSYTGISAALSVVVAGRYAYVGDGSTGLNIIDVSNPKTPVLVGAYAGITGSPYGVAVSGKYAYVADYTGGALRVVDVSDPRNPTLAGSYTIASGAPYAVTVSGKYAYVADQGNSKIYIVDISNPATPALVGTYSTITSPTALYVSGRYLYATDSTNGLYIIDVANPASSTLSSNYRGGTSSYYGVSVAGSYAYVGDRGGTSLLTLDVHNPALPQLVGTTTTASALGLSVSGKYAYLSGDTGGLKIVDLSGAELPTAHIGALESSQVNVSDDLTVGNNISAGGGLDVGISGIFSRGAISAFIASTTQLGATVANFMGGNVGIGTTTPYAALAVAGQAVFNYLTATGTVASTFPFASTTALTATSLYSSNAYFTSSTTINTLNLSNALGVAFGGTGANTFSSGQLLYGVGTGAVQTVATGTVSGSNGLSVTAGQYIIGSGLTITGTNAAADGSTKGVASFTANDFDSTTGNISIDYTNGQAATASAKGFLTSADWSIFNNKISSSSLAQIFPFTSDSNYGALANSTSTAVWFKSGLQASSTSQIAYASTTALTALNTISVGSTTPSATLSVQAASSSIFQSLFAVASTSNNGALSTLFSISNIGSTTLYQIPSSLLKTTANGVVVAAVAGSDYAAGNIGFPFTQQTQYGINTSATTTLLQLTNGLTASSTSHFVSADFTNATTSSFVATGSTTINTLNLSNALSVAFGGTGASTFSSGQLLYGVGTGAVQTVATGTVSAGSSAITVTSGRAAIGGALAIDCAGASASQNGCLSSTDWSTFNNKPTFGSFFNSSTYGTQAVISTSTGLWLTGSPQSLMASSSVLTFASSTALTVGNLFFTNGTSTGSLAISASSTIAGFLNAVGGANFGNITVSSCTGCSGSSFAWPWQTTTNYATTSSATTTVPWYQLGVTASSTSHFTSADFSAGATTTSFAASASTTIAGLLNAVGGATLGSTLTLPGLTTGQALTLNSSNVLTATSTLAASVGGTGQNTNTWSALPLVTAGVWSQYAGSAPCTNQVALSISASGVISCTSVTNAMLSNSSINATYSGMVTGSASAALGGTFAFSSPSWPWQTTTNYATTTYATTTMPWFQQGLSASSTSQIAYASTTALSVSGNAYFPVSGIWNSSGFVGIGTTSPSSVLSVGNFLNTAANTPLFTVASTTNGNATTTLFTILANGNVGLGTSTPYRPLSVTNTVTGGQLSVAYDAADVTEFRTDATGNLDIVPTGTTGGNIYMRTANLFVCGDGSITSNGACTAFSGTPTAGSGALAVAGKAGFGTSTPNWNLTVAGTRPSIDITDTAAGVNLKHWLITSEGGNLYVGTTTDGYATTSTAAITLIGGTGSQSGYVGFGTTSPSQQLSTTGFLFVGGNGKTTLGQATSTFYGDVKIAGKLDVSTIDPVYTIDGTKYATYGASTIGVHEEVLQTITLAQKDSNGKYAYVIDFDSLEKGGDVWLFYQVTDFGTNWKDLVVSLTPSFDASVYYEKVPGKHELVVRSVSAGEVSMRLSALRFDNAKWPNLRPDQNDTNYKGFEIPSKSAAGN